MHNIHRSHSRRLMSVIKLGEALWAYICDWSEHR